MSVVWATDLARSYSRSKVRASPVLSFPWSLSVIAGFFLLAAPLFFMAC